MDCVAVLTATGAFLSQLPAVSPQLVVLDLKNCRGLPGESIAAALGQLMALQRLTLDSIPEVRVEDTFIDWDTLGL